MKIGSENRRQVVMAGVLGLVALGAAVYVYEELFATSTPAPATSAPVVASVPAAPVSSAPPAAPKTSEGTAAKAVGTTSAALDPTLHMEAMLVSESVEYSGSGRNIFSPNSAPMVTIPLPGGPARPIKSQPVIQQVQQVAPPPVTCPPQCPPIDLKFFGVESSANGKRHAFLLHDDAVYLATDGDIVLRRYRVILIEAKSIQVEDMQNNNKQTLPLLADTPGS